jgi:prevent-host-death family protein
MNIAPIADVKARFSAYVEKTRQGPVVVTKNGRAVAVILRVQDDDDLERILLANSPKLRKILDAAEKRIQASGRVSHEDTWNTIEAAEET